jgi:exodeoxyribonuclease-3
MLSVGTWNINGLRRAAARNDDWSWTDGIDVLCLQEIRCDETTARTLFATIPGLNNFSPIAINASSKPGYSGVAMLVRSREGDRSPKWTPTWTAIPCNESVAQGRVVTADRGDVIVTSVYSVNAGQHLERLDRRTKVWEPALKRHLLRVSKGGTLPLVLVGDMNVARTQLDVHHPERHGQRPGYTQSERDAFERLMGDADLALDDAYRVVHPRTPGYTFWSPWASSRARGLGQGQGLGWRIDYVLFTRRHMDAVSATVVNRVKSSDHAPVVAQLAIDRRPAITCRLIALQLRAERSADSKDRYRALAFDRVLRQLEAADPGQRVNDEATFRSLVTAGVGQGILERVRGVIETGRLPDAVEEDSIKDGLTTAHAVYDISRIHGFSRAKAVEMVTEFDLKGAKDLAARVNVNVNPRTHPRVHPLDAQLTPQQLAGLEFMDDLSERVPRAEVRAHLHLIRRAGALESIRVHPAGSFRRGSKTSGDVDAIACCLKRSDFDRLVDRLVESGYIVRTLARGSQRLLAIARLVTPDSKHRRVDIVWTQESRLAFALVYLTGDADFTVAMRARAKRLGMTLNESRLIDRDGNDVPCSSERELFDRLGVKYVPPSGRIGAGALTTRDA